MAVTISSNFSDLSSAQAKNDAGPAVGFVSSVRNTVSKAALSAGVPASMAASLAALIMISAGSASANDEAAVLSATAVADKAPIESVLDDVRPVTNGSVPEVALAQKSPNPWLIGGAMALILAALVKLVGANRVMNIAAEAGPAIRKTAETIANAPKAAAKAVGSAMTSPLRFLALVGGLAMLGFTGISIFDLEWTAGIATGIGMTAVTWVGAHKLSRKLSPQRLWAKAKSTQAKSTQARSSGRAAPRSASSSSASD